MPPIGLLYIWVAPTPHELVMDKRLRYAGAPVALVAATTAEIAEEALELIDVSYEILTPVYDPKEAIKSGAPQLYEQFPNNIVPALSLPSTLKLGDIDKGFAEADEIIEGYATVSNAQNPLPPEPPSIIAEWDGSKLTVKGSMAMVGISNLYTALATKSELHDVRILPSYVGGNYGSKLICGNMGVIIYAAALAKETRKPVAMFYTKEEHLASYQIRMPCEAHYKIGIKKDGTVTAIKGEQLSDCGSFASTQEFMGAVGNIILFALAKCDNIDYDNQIVVTNKTASGAYRGFGYLECTALLTPFLEMAMEKIDIDPVAYYKKNVLRPGDRYFQAYVLQDYEISKGPDISRVVAEGAKKFDWANRWKGWGKPSSVNGSKRCGVGIGVSGQTDCGEQPSNAIVQLNAFGSATVYMASTEFGTGIRDVLCKIAAEELNLPLEKICLTPPDSLTNPWEWGSSGSRSTLTMGSAVHDGAKNAKRKLFEEAAPMFETIPDALETEDGYVFLKDAPEGQRLSWADILGWQNNITAKGHFKHRYDVNCCQVNFVEVEVDIETGAVQVVDHLGCGDAGQIINPLALKGQVDGFFPGLDLALKEETIWDKELGRIINPNMIDYKTRTFNEIPPHDVLLLENPPDIDPSAPFGAFGIAEATIAPTIPAVHMAIYNAIGKRFFEYPITPAKILKALEEGGGKQ